MAKLLVIEESYIVRGVFKEFLDKEEDFEYELVGSYAEAKKLLQSRRYEYAIAERTLKDAPNGEIIALLNKHNIAPLLFTKEIDEEFFDAFEGAQIVEYVIKRKFNNIENVVTRLKQIHANKRHTILVLSDSHIQSSYLKQTLQLHNFKVVVAANNDEAFEKLSLHNDIALVVFTHNEPYMDTLAFVKKFRQFEEKGISRLLYLADESNSYQTSTLLSAGADDFIVQPFSRHEFYTRVYQNINKLC